MDTSPDGVTIVAATAIEARAVRRRAPGARVLESGVALSRVRDSEPLDVAISCGLAGGLRDDLPTGTILIPDAVRTAQGESIACDVPWVARLRAAARSLGHDCIDLPLLTSGTLVTGDERAHWAQRGFAGVDMETAALAATRIAAVRVILDTPQRELSAEWLHPMRALLRPSNWAQAFWLAREAPRCSDLAARVVAAALLHRG